MQKIHNTAEPTKEEKFNFKSAAKGFGIYLLRSLKAFWVHLVIIAVLVILDLLTKTAIDNSMLLYESIEVIPNFFNLTYTHNYGASFGMMQGGRVIFLIVTPIALIFFFYLLFSSKTQKKIYAICLIMIIAGTLGNFADRAAYGYVRDFAEVIYFGYDVPLIGRSFAIFNVADALLVVGIIIFAVYYIFFYKSKDGKRNGAKSLAKAEAPKDSNPQ